ncbi:MAG: helix-turn-helix transcriptional regulator [Sulfuritalea sp.]|nr:helix-turn-helix transcriptional regulator [Sulfuritalea sp.]
MRRVVPVSFPDDPLVADTQMFGRAVRAARTQSGLTLEDAALAVGVAKQTLQHLETGKPSVGLGLALKIAQAMGVALFALPAADKERGRRRLMEGRDHAA